MTGGEDYYDGAVYKLEQDGPRKWELSAPIPPLIRLQRGPFDVLSSVNPHVANDLAIDGRGSELEFELFFFKPSARAGFRAGRYLYRFQNAADAIEFKLMFSDDLEGV